MAKSRKKRGIKMKAVRLLVDDVDCTEKNSILLRKTSNSANFSEVEVRSPCTFSGCEFKPSFSANSFFCEEDRKKFKKEGAHGSVLSFGMKP